MELNRLELNTLHVHSLNSCHSYLYQFSSLEPLLDLLLVVIWFVRLFKIDVNSDVKLNGTSLLTGSTFLRNKLEIFFFFFVGSFVTFPMETPSAIFSAIIANTSVQTYISNIIYII